MVEIPAGGVELAEAARNDVLSRTLPRTDYYRAGFIGRYFKAAEIVDEIKGLN